MASGNCQDSEHRDELRVETADDGRIVISREHDAPDEFIGDIPGLSAATNLQEIRDEWER